MVGNFFMTEKILRFPEVQAKVPVSRRTIYNWERDGKFPKRVPLGKNSVGWLESEVDAHIAAQAAKRAA